MHLHFNGRVPYKLWVCTYCALFHSCWWSHRTPLGSSSERISFPSMVIHMAHSLWLDPLRLLFLLLSLPNVCPRLPLPPSSCSLSCSTRRTWQTCAAPRRTRVRTPWRSSSPLHERWWADSVECYCHLRNVQDLLANWKTPQERRLGEPFKGPLISFGAIIRFLHEIDQDLINFAKKVLPGICLAYELITVRIWKGDILMADLEDLEKLDASVNYPRRINAKEVLITQKRDEFIFPVADGTAKLSGRDYDFREPTEAGTDRKERRSQWRTSRRTGRVSTDRIKRWRWSPDKLLICSRWLHLSPSQRSSSSTLCDERRNHSLFHWNTWIGPGLHSQSWMCCKKNV